ncbi:hypothetical protein AAE478_000749 [Parahypoxylon ruwenzoriense]
MDNDTTPANDTAATTGADQPSQPEGERACEESLKIIIERHEEIIQKRWIGKSKTKRRALLRKVWPTIPVSRRPDFTAYNAYTKNSVNVKDADTTPFKWPYINLDDMSKTEPLLLMLNSRARNTPDTFAYIDLASTLLGRRSGWLVQGKFPSHIMMLRGRTTPSTYGELYPWDEDHAARCGHAHKAYTPGDGFLILEVQCMIYSFLFGCCKEIIHDVPEQCLMNKNLPIQPEPPMVSSKANSEDIRFLATTSFEDRYKAPAKTDFNRLETLLWAAIGDTAEHLRSLRQDPGYFERAMNQCREHRLESLPDTNGQPDPLLTLPTEDEFWGRVLCQIISHALHRINALDKLYRKISYLCFLVNQHTNNNISPEEDLPPEFAEAFYGVKFHLVKFLPACLRKDIMAATYGSAPFRPYFCRGMPNPEDRDQITICAQANVTPPESGSKVMSCIRTLSNERQRSMLGPKDIFIELELYMQQDPSAKSFMTPLVANWLSYPGLLCEFLHQIDLYQPWAAGFEHYARQHDKCLEEDLAEGSEYSYNLYDMGLKIWVKLAPLGCPKGGKFHYPVDEPRSKETTEAMRQAEANLDIFWKRLVRDLKTRKVLSPLTRDIICGDFRKTEPWVEPRKLSKKAKEEEKKKEEQKEESLTKWLKDLGLETPARAHKVKGKMKEQTKTDVKSSDGSVEDEAEESGPTSFKVNKRALKVFSALFFDGPNPSQAGDITWADFIHAMASMGFTAEKLFGSAWHFEPAVGMGFCSSIQLHEPPSENKIPFVTTRLLGQRLARSYGWKRDMFQLAT